ncbi:MAG: cytochrome C oxidase subunit IV family protein [Myxococcota bacterium]|nr:cytochrome C oxidase subunit IV family protein [Myxococcales bacterium]
MSAHEAHGDEFYVKTWAILLVLLLISVLGPLLGHPVLTLITAFGIAVVKAYLVAVRFMHINLTPRFVTYAVATTLVFMLLFFAGTAPDVMKNHGTNWVKPAWIQAEAAYAAEVASGAAGHHGAGGHGEAPHGEAAPAHH